MSEHIANGVTPLETLETWLAALKAWPNVLDWGVLVEGLGASLATSSTPSRPLVMPALEDPTAIQWLRLYGHALVPLIAKAPAEARMPLIRYLSFASKNPGFADGLRQSASELVEMIAPEALR